MTDEFDDLDAGSSEEDDPLDADDFNPVDYINRQFPNEASLGGLDALVERLKQQQASMDADIRTSIRRQAACGRRAREDLDEARAAVTELFARMKSIQAKAEQSEALVSDVCRDIKSLDIAKRNLTLTVTALKRLAMFVTALEQLLTLTKSRKYLEASVLIHAIDELSEHFKSLSKIPRVADLLERKAAVRSELREQLLADYASLHGPEHARQSGIETAAACVDAMGPSVRRDVITQFCLNLLEGYKDLFQPPKEFSALETTERRYAWLKRTLKEYEEKYAPHFPANWRVPCGLCEHFCHVTRQHLVEVLGMSVQTIDPELMVRVLRKSIDFENELASKYPADQRALDAANSSSPDYGSAPGFKYPEVLGKGGSSSSSAGAHANGDDKRHTDDDDVFAPRFKGIISESFDAYLGSWVQHEEKQLLDSLERSTAAGADKMLGMEDDDRGDDDDGLEPKLTYHSATELFIGLKGSVTKCCGFSTQQTLFDIFQVTRRVLAQYAETLKAKFPAKVSVPLDVAAVQACCCVIGTAEYCDEMVPKLAAEVAKAIDSTFEDRINFDREQDLLRNMMNKANQALVQSVNCSLDEAFAKMTKTNWAQYSHDVGDNSPFVGDISERLAKVFEPIAKYMSKIHYRFFCDKFVQAFVSRFISELYKCRKISEQGAKQLLLDTGLIKTALLDAPASVAGGHQMQTAYSNYVLREMGRAELMLKVLSSPELDAAQVRAMLGETSLTANEADTEIRRLLALRATSADEPPPVPSPRDRDDDVIDVSSGLQAMASTMTSLGAQFNQKSSKTTEDLKKISGDVKKKLFGVAGLTSRKTNT
eukprot:TRINITY_DN56548_c0_g1_i1.p1 TRINITY_DN56548_c0_g1~~TRINITY_DN56548_c0_g1_i1.p1  ORF type:complete len:824 (-),score=169.75 TRINITY_DN56548_c0_g1_i1:8-2479(-)